MNNKKGEGVYPVVVIGAGTAGLVTAAGAAGLVATGVVTLNLTRIASKALQKTEVQ